jgi:hypothetical protein
MANEIRIEPSTETLVRGQATTVPITLVLDRRLKVRGIHGKFMGAEETRAVYTTTSSDGKGRVTTQTHTAIQHTEIVSQVYLLAGNEKMGFFGNMSDAVATVFGGGKHDTLEAGEHPFEVEVSIPEDAAATHVGKKTRVFYELSLRVDVPAGFDVKATQCFHVVPIPLGPYTTESVRTRYPDDAGRGLFESLVSPDVKLEMALAADKYQPDESIDGIFKIETEANKSLNCRRIFVQILGIETSTAHGHKDRYLHVGDPIELECPENLTGVYTQEFSIPAKTTAPLSASGKLFSIDWFVQVQLDVPWAKDPRIRAPIELLPGV